MTSTKFFTIESTNRTLNLAVIDDNGDYRIHDVMAHNWPVAEFSDATEAQAVLDRILDENPGVIADMRVIENDRVS